MIAPGRMAGSSENFPRSVLVKVDKEGREDWVETEVIRRQDIRGEDGSRNPRPNLRDARYSTSG